MKSAKIVSVFLIIFSLATFASAGAIRFVAKQSYHKVAVPAAHGAKKAAKKSAHGAKKAAKYVAKKAY